jgi:plasmid stabilization system protein ParE
MMVMMLAEAEEDLERAYRHYERLRPGLGDEMVDQFRRGIERIILHPNAWQALDATYRRYRLRRFPYGIVYRVDAVANTAIIVAVMHLSQKPGWWKSRE